MTQAVIQDDDLVLDDQHRYWWKGVRVPGVTEVIERVGLVDYSAPWFTEKAKHYGIVVHKACALIDQGVLDAATVDPRIRPDVDAYLRWRDLMGPMEPVDIETPRHHPLIWFAGTLDVSFQGQQNRLLVVDRKRGFADKTCAIQTAAYALLQSHHHNIPLSLIDRYALDQLGTGRAVMKKFDDRSDYAAFQGAVAVVNWADRNGVKLKGDSR